MPGFRRGEEKRDAIERTRRFFETDEGWFLRTREGIPVGPYESKFDVEIAASLLSPKLAELAREGRNSEILTTIQVFLSDPSYGPNKKRPIPERTPPLAAGKTFARTYLPVVKMALKRGYTDFVEQSAHIVRSTRKRISKRGSIRKSN